MLCFIKCCHVRVLLIATLLLEPAAVAITRIYRHAGSNVGSANLELPQLIHLLAARVQSNHTVDWTDQEWQDVNRTVHGIAEKFTEKSALASLEMKNASRSLQMILDRLDARVPVLDDSFHGLASRVQVNFSWEEVNHTVQGLLDQVNRKAPVVGHVVQEVEDTFKSVASSIVSSLTSATAKATSALMPGPKVLLYWAAKYDEAIIDLIIHNVDTLRCKGLNFDVLLGHYDLNKEQWLQRNGSWYEKNIKWGVDAKGWKVHLFRTIHNNQFAPGLNLSDYKWVWMFDEDLDVKNTNPLKMFEDAEATGSLIVGPTFEQLAANQPSLTEKPFYPMNVPQAGSRFRYVPVVEIIMPLVRPCVLQYMFATPDAMAPQDHDWGMDHAWCSYISQSLKWSQTETCAVLDDTGPIVHLNFKSTRGDSGKAKTATTGNEAIAWVKSHLADHYVSFPRSRYVHWQGYNQVNRSAPNQAEDGSV